MTVCRSQTEAPEGANGQLCLEPIDPRLTGVNNGSRRRARGIALHPKLKLLIAKIIVERCKVKCARHGTTPLNLGAGFIGINSFRNPDPDFQIDNPKEVVTAMRDEDFSRNYVLNVTIVDCLLADPSAYETLTRRLLNFIASDFDACEKFMSSYYARGKAVTALISRLATTWPGFVAAAVTSAGSLMHVARIISHLPDARLKDLASRHPALTEFISNRLADILTQEVDFPADRLRSLDVEATDLAAVAAHPVVMRVLFDEGLYQLSIDNLDFILRAVLVIDDPDRAPEQNYTVALGSGSEALLSKIDGCFDEYMSNVLLRLPDNRQESVSTIQRVIGRSDVELESMVEFLEKQSAALPTLDQVPGTLHATLFQIEKIEATWENSLTFLGGENYDAETLVQFLNSAETLRALTGQKVPGSDQAAPLRKFIIENDALSDEAYAAYVGALPRRFKAFPQHLSTEKTKILVDRNATHFSASNLAHLSEDPPLGVAFVEKNIVEFFEAEEQCNVDDDFRQKLLEADISDENRLRIIRTMDLNLLAELPARAATVGQILARTGIKRDEIGVDSACVILNAKLLATQISLFNMLHEMFDDQQVKDMLRSLPDPLPDIRPGFGTPRIESSEVNLEFVAWLKARGFISSWKRGGFFDDDIRMNMFRK